MVQTNAWKPGPAYLSRLMITKRWLPLEGNGLHILEVGCGESGFACWVAMRDFSVTAIDICEHSCLVQRQRSQELGLPIEIFCTEVIPTSRFYDFVCAFEVIEHIKDDISTLRDFRRALTKGGTLILSVPANMRKWSKFDELCGHVRRYERHELLEKLECSGFGQIEIVSRGFPIVNIVHKLDTLIRRNDPVMGNTTARSQSSGGVGFRKVEWLIRPLGFTLYPLIAAQCLFYNTDLGEGYSVKAVAT